MINIEDNVIGENNSPDENNSHNNDKQTSYSISGCIITNTSTPMSEDQCNALAELAKAAKANADAMGKIADALKGPTVIMERGISIGE